jgi:hypothetical protein
MPGVWSRNTRVLVSIALLAAASLAIGGAAFSFTESEQSAISAAAARLDALHDIAGDIADAVDGQEGALDDFDSHLDEALDRILAEEQSAG